MKTGEFSCSLNCAVVSIIGEEFHIEICRFTVVSSDSPGNKYKKALCDVLFVKSGEFAVALTALLYRFKAQQSI